MKSLHVKYYARMPVIFPRSPKKSKMIQDVALTTESCTEPTFDSYVSALEKLFVIQDIDSWSPAVRSATATRRGKKEVLQIHLLPWPHLDYHPNFCRWI